MLMQLVSLFGADSLGRCACRCSSRLADIAGTRSGHQDTALYTHLRICSTLACCAVSPCATDASSSSSSASTPYSACAAKRCPSCWHMLSSADSVGCAAACAATPAAPDAAPARRRCDDDTPPPPVVQPPLPSVVKALRHSNRYSTIPESMSCCSSAGGQLAHSQAQTRDAACLAALQDDSRQALSAAMSSAAVVCSCACAAAD